MEKFVKEFLKIGNLNSAQKDKMIELFERDRFQNFENKILDKVENSQKNLVDKIQKLEDKIFNSVPNSEIEKPIQNHKGKKHSPKDTHNFLLNFSNSKYIKYLTHRFNSEVWEYDDFIKNCKKEIEEQQQEYPNVSDKVLARIRQFAFEENPNWFIYKGTKKIDFKVGWSTEEFKNWYNEHKKHPADNDFWNKEMIIPFKESIEIRTGNLSKIVEDVQNQYTEFQIETENLDQAEFYTNADMLYQTFQKIFGCIKDNAYKNFQFNVKIAFEKTKMNTISITHIGSECKRKSDYDFKKGDFNDLKNNLWGIGNLEIQAKFEDGYFRKIILTDDEKQYNKTEEITSVEGFTYILKFY